MPNRQEILIMTLRNASLGLLMGRSSIYAFLLGSRYTYSTRFSFTKICCYITHKNTMTKRPARIALPSTSSKHSQSREVVLGWKGLTGRKCQDATPSTRFELADTYDLAPPCACSPASALESEVCSCEWAYLVLEKAGRRLVLYLRTGLLLKSYVLKNDNMYWRCMRVCASRRACCLACYFWNMRCANTARMRSNSVSKSVSSR